MKVAIIGGGFTGWAAGVELAERGVEVKIFESGDSLGGLAGGFKPWGWQWSLEKYYHHIFANDEAIKELAKKVGWGAFFLNPKTVTWRDGIEAELDTPVALMKYPGLSLWGKLRMG